MLQHEVDRVFTPFEARGLRFKNRIVHVPTTLNMSDPLGHVNAKAVGAYESLARGGAAAVIVGATCVRWDGLINERMLGLYDDTYVIGMRDLVEVIHGHEAIAGVQLFYGGTIPGLGSTVDLEAGKGWIPNTISWGPTANYPIGNASPGVLSTGDYESLVESYGQAARRAREAGYDFVSFHFCHGSLPHTTLSLLTNQGRQDKYADRFLFCEEIIRRTQQLCGRDFPIVPRLCCDENLEDGYDIDYFADHYAPRLAELGISVLDATFGSMVPGVSRRSDIHSTEFIGGNFYTPPLVNLDNIRRLRQRLTTAGIDMPLIGSCKVDTPDRVRQMVAHDAAEFAGVSRLSLDDPDFPNKMRQRREDEVRKSTHTGASLLQGNIFGKGWAGSPQNANFGRDREYRIVPAARPKKIVVAGGGSGGLEYARVAHAMGHEVVVFEQQAQLGGVMDWAGNYDQIPNTECIRYQTEYLLHQMQLLGVDCRTGQAATPDLIRAEQPDVVVIATGAKARLPEISGLKAAREAKFALTMDEVMRRKDPIYPGQNIIIYGAGEGMELALNLARQGRSVRLLDSALQLLPANYIGSRSGHVLRWLAQAGIAFEGGVRLHSIGSDSITVRHGDVAAVHDAPEGMATDLGAEALIRMQHAQRGNADEKAAGVQKIREEIIACDSVILSLGRVADRHLADAFSEDRFTVQVIGDARRPRSYGNAIHEANYLVRQI